MSTSNDSILVTPGAGATVATHTPIAGGAEYQAVMICDPQGHLLGSKNKYFYNIVSQVHVAAAGTCHWDMFNASTSLVRITSISQMPNITTAVTGVAFDWLLVRTTVSSSSGSAVTAVLPDTGQTALPATITCKTKGLPNSTGVTVKAYTVHSEETNAAAQMTSAMMMGGVADLIPIELRSPQGAAPGLVLHSSEGLKCIQVTNSVQGNTSWSIGFSVESTG